MAARRRDVDVDALIAVQLDLAVVDGAADPARRREEFGRGEIVAAMGGVDEVQHDRLAGAQPDRARVEIEIGERDLDGPGLGLGRERRGEQGERKQQQMSAHDDLLIHSPAPGS